jgi:hypothetical protein
VFKHIGRIALAVLVTLALSLGLTAFAGSANAASSASSCSSEHTNLVKAKKQVKKDKKKIKKAKRHHNQKAVKRLKRKIRSDRARLAQSRHAYYRCVYGQSAPAPAPPGGGNPTPAPSNPVTDQCTAFAGQLTAHDPSGQLATGSAAFCDLLGQLAGATGGDPLTVCDQLAAQDPTAQFGQLCDALRTGPGLPALPGLPSAPGAPSGGDVGDTLGDVCDQLVGQDPTGQLGQLGQLCAGLHSLPI